LASHGYAAKLHGTRTVDIRSVDAAQKRWQRDMDLGIDDADQQWWFNLSTQSVEQGAGSGNHDRMGPYATREEAAGALERARSRNEAFDADEDD
jgi:hypothetical protein